MIENKGSITDINARNQEFWEKQRVLMDQRLSDEATAGLAYEMMKDEIKSQPFALQRSYEKILEIAAGAKNFLCRHLASKGGKAAKGDSLQKLIEEIVSKNPALSETQLFDALKNNEKIPPLEDIDDETIFFTNSDGRSKSTPISGLKDRLSRAKKKIKSR